MVNPGALVLYRPERMVDNANYCWRGQLDPDIGWAYSHDDTCPREVSSRSVTGVFKLEHLLAERSGGLRPMVEPCPDEVELVRVALADAGRKAVTTLAWVLHMVVRSAGIRSLLAGMRGEARGLYLREFEVWGGGVDIGRVDTRAARVLRNQVLDWLWNPHQVVAAVEVLVDALAEVADMRAARCMDELGADEDVAASLAWFSVADRMIQPDTYEGARWISRVGYAFLVGSARRFDLAWWEQWDAGLRPDWSGPQVMGELLTR